VAPQARGEGEWPPEYYEPLLTEAELRALMSDEDIELRDEEREALLGRDEGTKGRRDETTQGKGTRRRDSHC
jgi:hypothetical protein